MILCNFAAKYTDAVSVDNYKSITITVRYLYITIIIAALFGCVGCENKWKNILLFTGAEDSLLVIERYDRIEGRYISTGDFAALQEMSTRYPEQTRMLIEDVARIGRVNDPEINQKFLVFFQDSTLQQLFRDVQDQYAQMDDVNDELRESFERLQQLLSIIHPPMIYTQVGALDQSIVIGNNSVGINLDKYLGKDYPLYSKYYEPQQREQMTREMIVPDVLMFYVLSLYPMPDLHGPDAQIANDVHISKIMWIVNKVMNRKMLSMKYVPMVDKYMAKHNQTTALKLLTEVDYSDIVK